MPRKPKDTPDNPDQSKRFIETAREIETDENPEAFERAFGAVVSRRQAAKKTNKRATSSPKRSAS